ncbi:MAG: hypothetical protein WC314_15880 [Vulcanimicrobiota bacterium]
MIAEVRKLVPQLGQVSQACEVLSIPRSTYYHSIASPREHNPKEKSLPPNALSPEERQEVLDHLHSDRFIDKTPVQAYHTLLDEGIYIGSVRTIYRILEANNEVRERRAQRRHANYQKPELIATAPNQVWTWDIVRHEAFSDRAEVKDLRGPPVAAVGHKLRAARTGERRER